jgi:hypothetical protein
MITIINEDDDQSEASMPQIINIHITVTMKNMFQLSISDCRVDLFL